VKLDSTVPASLAKAFWFLITGIYFLELCYDSGRWDEWSFLTKHAWALICIAHDPGVRLRDIAVELRVTERSAYAIVNDLSAAGYVVKDKDGRRNRYEIQGHLPMKDAIGRERTIGDVLEILVDPTVPMLAERGRQRGPDGALPDAPRPSMKGPHP
jgi:hypothetical protein